MAVRALCTKAQTLPVKSRDHRLWERERRLITAAASPTHGKDRYVVIILRDSLGILLLVLLLPLWMAVGLGFVALVVARHLYWWARGNTTAVSRGAVPAL